MGEADYLPANELESVVVGRREIGLGSRIAFLGIVLLQLYLAARLGLSDDEAWYWALAREPALSYHVHPPLGIWLIRASTAVFGDAPLAVRLPSIGCSAFLIDWLFRFSNRLGLRPAASSLLAIAAAPMFLFGGILAGPDQPLVVGWIGVLGTGYDLAERPVARATDWWKLGAFLGISLLSKYTAFLAIPALFASLATSDRGRKVLREPGLYAALALALVLFSPVLFWNAAHGWASFRFQFHDRHHLAVSFPRLGLSSLAQLFVFGPALIGAFVSLFFNARFDRRVRYLAAWTAVPASVFFVQPLFGDFKVHWPLVAYLPVLVYLGWALRRRTFHAYWRTVSVAGIALSSLFVVASLEPVLPAVYGALEPGQDVTNDFYGWSSLPGALAKAGRGLGALPIVTSRYQIAAQAAFALKDKRRVAIIPHLAHELADWGGTESLPDRFIYLADNRYGGDPESLYAGYRCAPLDPIRTLRRGHLAKEIFLRSCARHQVAGR